MAKAIYIVKLFMLKHQTPQTVISLQEVDTVNRMAMFIILLYRKDVLHSVIPAAALRHDLEF